MVLFGKGKKMKTSCGTVLVLAMATAILLIMALPCVAAEKEGENIWDEDEPKRQHRWTEERIEHVLNLLREADPEKVKELEKLRNEDPEQFKTELRKAMRAQWAKRAKERKDQRSHRTPGAPDRPFMRREGREGREGPGGGRGRPTRRRDGHGEFLEWLKKNYPEEAEKLAGLKEEKPKLHMRRMELVLRRYRKIFEAEKENPKLAQVLKEDLQLKKKRDKLLRKIKAAADDNEKKELTAQLKEIVNSRFDLIVRRKQIAYEQLSKQLEKLKERVKKSEAEVDKWKDSKFKNENVKTRLEELVSETEKIRWD